MSAFPTLMAHCLHRLQQPATDSGKTARQGLAASRQIASVGDQPMTDEQYRGLLLHLRILIVLAGPGSSAVYC